MLHTGNGWLSVLEERYSCSNRQSAVFFSHLSAAGHITSGQLRAEASIAALTARERRTRISPRKLLS